MKVGNYTICDNCIEAVSEIEEVESPPVPGEPTRIAGYSFYIYTKGGNKLEVFSKDKRYVESQYNKIISHLESQRQALLD